MTKKKLLSMTAITVASVAVVCMAGVTFAINTSESRSKGTFTTAGLDLTATAKNVKVYSAVKISDGDDLSEVFYDEYGAAYRYQQSVAQGDAVIEFTAHDGGVVLAETEKVKSIAINNMMPGDKVEFDIEVSSASTIAFNYRAELYVDATMGQTLLNQLDFSAGELGLLRKEVTEENAEESDLAPAILTDYTAWTTFSANQASIEYVHVSITLPITAKEGQGESVQFYYVASGIQNTELQPDVVRFELGGETVGFKSLADAVVYAQENDIIDIPVIGNTVFEEGTIIVGDALHFIGVQDEEGNYPVLKGARFVIENSAAAVFDHINFSGESYIDVSKATVVTLSNCKADVTPVRYFDSVSRTYLQDAAFIVSGSTLTPVRLTVSDCEIVTGQDAAVNLRSPLFDGSTFTGNVFGKETSPYDGTAVLMFNGCEGDDPVVKVTNNTLYGNCAMSLGGTGKTYLVISENNTAYGIEGGIFVNGTSCAAFVDNGSKIGGTALQCTDIAEDTILFGGVDVTLNTINRITEGKFVVSGELTKFFTDYVVGNTLAKNAVILYRGGSPYAYLNAASNEVGYVLDEID